MWLELRVQQKLPVPLGPENWRFDDISMNGQEVQNCLPHSFDSLLLCCGVFYDTAFSDVFPSGFKLWFHKDHQFTSAAVYGKSSVDHRR